MVQLERVSRFASRRRVLTILVWAALLIPASFGVLQLDARFDSVDLLPEGERDTEAAKVFQTEFPSGYTQQVTLHVTTDVAACQADASRIPFRQTTSMCGNITDEVYIRAMDDFQRYVEAQPDQPFQEVITAASFHRLLNWTTEGGRTADPATFSLPGTDPAGSARFALLDEGLRQSVPEALYTAMGLDGTSYVVVLIGPVEGGFTPADLGRAAQDLVAGYVAEVEADARGWTVFGAQNPPTFYVEQAVAEARYEEIGRGDAAVLAPILVVVLVASLWFAYRSTALILPTLAVVMLPSLALVGMMGWLGLPFSGLNLLALPIFLGVGLDQAIHVTVGLRQRDARALPVAIGSICLAAATSVVGLLALVGSSVPAIVEFAWLAAAGLVVLFLASWTLLPALVRSGVGAPVPPSKWMVALTAPSVRRPVLGILVAGLLAVVAGFGAAGLEPAPLGDYASRLEPSDPLREQHEANLQDFYLLGPQDELLIGNVLVFSGPQTEPATLRYIQAVRDALEDQPGVRVANSQHLPALISQYDIVRNGLPGAGVEILLQSLGPDADPREERTREENEEILEEAFAGPMRTFASLFVNPSATASVLTLSTQVGDTEAVRESYDSVERALAATEDHRPSNVEVGFVGTTATNVLFLEAQASDLLPVALLALAGLLVLAAIALGVAGGLLATGVVAAAAVVWLGALSLFGFGLSVDLLVSVAFVAGIGSDYAIHALLARRLGQSRSVVRGVVGRAILFGAITDLLAFLVFMFSRDQALKLVMSSAALAVTSTLLVVLLAYGALLSLHPRRPHETERQRADEGIIHGE